MQDGWIGLAWLAVPWYPVAVHLAVWLAVPYLVAIHPTGWADLLRPWWGWICVVVCGCVATGHWPGMSDGVQD